MKLSNYLFLCFFISATNGADVLKMEPRDKFCSSADETVYLQFTGGSNNKKNNAWGYERTFSVYTRPEVEAQQPVGIIRLCFSASERNVVLDRLEIDEKFRRLGYGRGAVIVGLKLFTNRLGFTFDTFRVVVTQPLPAEAGRLKLQTGSL